AGPPAPTPPSAPARDRAAPDTRIVSGPGSRLRQRRAAFRFSATEKGSRFECALDGERFARCRAATTLRELKRGRHVLRVRAVDAAGNHDRTPAVAKFTVPRR
ncbi:MAG: hypothetical protein JHC95_17860, partial [Solirubrobacteraceae bacterium]|nr:hypothetical protein [Solirubrobacteraceae bacterium]